MNILVVAPHPDDEVLGVAGTIRKRTKKRSNKVFVCVVTRCYLEQYDEEVIEAGRRECSQCCKLLHAEEPIFLDFPANKLSLVPLYEIADSIHQIIVDNEIDEVYIPHYGDAHQDHKVVFDACVVAVRPKGPVVPKRVYAYEVVSETGWNAPSQHNEFIPNVYEDITEEVNQKVFALAHYQSQLQQFPETRSTGMIKALAKYRGATVGVEAAEAFMLIREIKGGGDK